MQTSKKLISGLLATVTAVSLFAPAALGTNGQQTVAQAATKSTKTTITVNGINTSSKTVTGTATKGAKVTVYAKKGASSSNAGKSKIASATASSKTGKFTVKLPKTYKKGTKLYVYATNGKYSYMYRIVTVTAKSTSKKTTTTSSSSSSKTSSTYGLVSSVAGTWKSSSYKGYYTKWTLTSGKKITVKRYKSGAKTKTLLSGTYTASTSNKHLWKVNAKVGSKTETFYLRFRSASSFYVVNSKNTRVKENIGQGAQYYSYSKVATSSKSSVLSF
ncbi:Ig-like domain-containing protein [Lactiplantibacillus daowaiensis]|uniref:Ig-like domain-containing protein n=1 Tax=Lactiplantibacillus daowaiensis TaxID=2559918 RepID=A0ABW1S3K6_9LACO|nr:Ig-like domain-containing protein [Lactiplantibacillus daowaiensis]